LSSTDSSFGTAHLSIHIESVGVLSKRQTIGLRRLVLTLTSPGEVTIRDTTALSGAGGVDIKTTIGNLAAPRSWSLAASTYDQSDSIIHSGSVDFSTIPADTVEVPFNLDAKFSMLRASFNNIPDSVTKLSVSVDGVVKTDSIITAGSLDTVVLGYDYLSATKAGAIHTVVLKATGRCFGIDTILFAADTTLNVKSGENKVHTITMKWVGPKINHAPVFSSLPTDMRNSINVDSQYVDTVHALDYDKDPISFSFKDSVAGMRLRDSIITWMPTAKDTGNKTISIVVIDNKGARDTLAWTISVSFSGPHSVARPAMPSGPQNGAPGTKYGFVTTPFLCSHHDSLQYRFLWGNGTYGSWRKNFADSVIWPSYGINKVQVQARCSIDTTLVSDTSQGFLVGILNGPDGTLFDDCDGDTAMRGCRWGPWWWVFNDSGYSCDGRSVSYNNAHQIIHSWPDSNEFRLTPGEGNPFGSGGACAKTTYQLDTISHCNDSLGKLYNYAGMGICLDSDCDIPRNLTGLTKITFWAKAAVPTDVEFIIGTTDIQDNSNFRCRISITTSWQKYEVPITSFVQPGWGNPRIPLHLDKAIKMLFELGSVSPNPRNGTFWVDDIYFQGYSWKP
jgi:hypothetical protein